MSGKNLLLLGLSILLLPVILWVVTIVLGTLSTFFPFLVIPTSMFVALFTQLFGILASQYFLQQYILVVVSIAIVGLVIRFITNRFNGVEGDTKTVYTADNEDFEVQTVKGRFKGGIVRVKQVYSKNFGKSKFKYNSSPTKKEGK